MKPEEHRQYYKLLLEEIAAIEAAYEDRLDKLRDLAKHHLKESRKVAGSELDEKLGSGPRKLGFLYIPTVSTEEDKNSQTVKLVDQIVLIMSQHKGAMTTNEIAKILGESVYPCKTPDEFRQLRNRVFTTMTRSKAFAKTSSPGYWNLEHRN